MSRIARIVVQGVPYHVTQRGNARQQVFYDATDYRLYLDLLRAYAGDRQLRVWAYCLMPNHVHLIVVPERPQAMATALGRTHADFARNFNLRRRSCGHVWQARYFSCPLDGAHLWRATAYVERNPVRAGLVQQAERYRWSSARARLGLDPGDPVLELDAWRAEYTRAQWLEALDTSVDEEAFGRRLHESSRRGRPLGGEAFTEELENRVGRRLRPSQVGRPRKSKFEEDGQLPLEIGI
jgi:putative transposase